MRNKFLLFSVLFTFALLIFLGYPQISLAAQSPAVNSGAVGAGLTTANASGTITGAGSDGDTGIIGGCGFVWGTQPGIYTATSSKFDEAYATTSEFGWVITVTGGTGGDYNSSSTLSKGTVYYLKTYASTSVGRVYGAIEKTFLTGIDIPDSLAKTAETQTSISLSWTKGTGANNTIIRHRTDRYPTAVDDANSTQGYKGSGTSCSVDSLSCGTTYYFSTWSSTTATAALSTTSDSYSQLTASNAGCTVPITGAGGGRTCVGPNVFADSLVINQGQEYTQTREVKLSIKADSATLMSVCNDSRFIGCSLEFYSTTKSWTLTEGDGEKTVYAVFTSDCGMNSDYVSDTITLKTPVPAPVVPTPVEEVVKEAPAEEVVKEAPIEEVTVESLKAKITELQQKIIELLKQLIQLLQQQIAELLGE